MDRREFVKTSAFAGMTAASASRVMGANDRIRLGVIGTGGRGKYLMSTVNRIGGAEWVALCDIWDVRRAEGAKTAGSPVKLYNDHRQLLDHQDIDAVIIATVDHHHAPVTIDAVHAGKDVYVEKPMTSVAEQGPEVVKAVRETKRIVQVGTQNRSLPHYQEAKARIIDSGLLGKVGLVRTWYDANSGYLLDIPQGMETKPAGLDWERYLGWLPKIPWDARRYFNRFAYWDISTGGQTGGLFVHLIDTVHWFLGLARPSAALCGGGLYLYDDGRDTPDVVTMIVEYPQRLTVTFEAEIFTATKKYNATAGVEFHGSGGVLTVNRYDRQVGWTFAAKSEESPRQVMWGEQSPAGADYHLKNWLECIRSRKDPYVTAVDGHYGAMPCHMGNLAYKTKSRVAWDSKWEV